MDATLQAEKREGRGKNEARRLRASGRIPAVVYGAEKGKAVEIAVDPKMLLRILHSESGVNTLIGLQLDGGGLARAGQGIPARSHRPPAAPRRLLPGRHGQDADGHRPGLLKGEPKGVKQQGGVVDFVHREIEIEVLPGDIPENITVDISELMLNQGVRVRDVMGAEVKWKATSDADMMIVHVVAPRAEEAPAAADAAAAPAATSEPEVIKKGKTDKDDDEKTEKKK